MIAGRIAETGRTREPATPAENVALGWRFMTPLGLGSVLNPINSSMIATALIPIGNDLDVSATQTASLVSSLYLACAVAQPTLGRIGDVLGARRVFLLGTFLVGIGSLVGATASALWCLVLARVLIGIGTSAAYPNAILIIRRRELEAPTLDPRPALGVLTLTAQVTAAAGLPLGGVLVAAWGWRSIFLFNLIPVVLCLVMTLLWIPRDPRSRAGSLRELFRRIDPFGVLLFGGAMSGLLIALQSLGSVNVVALVGFVLGMVALLVWELRARSPFIDIRSLARNGPLSRTYLRTALTYATTYTMMFGFTQWLQDDRGFPAWLAGLAMLPMTAVAAILGWFVSRRGTVRLALRLTGLAVVGTSTGMAFLTDSTPLPFIFLTSLGFGIVLGCMSPSNQSALYRQAPADNIGASAGLFRTSIYLGAIGSSALTAMAFSSGVDAGSLRIMAASLVAAGVALMILTFTDRSLPRRIRPSGGDADDESR
ncbi:MFS transporter [Rhodococcus sp. NPDC057529]|uniref:MFS transporter n=1 Tax=Rhodococcus sp. NPDC057529 TaxID=3346158 RepID=UPI00366E9067